MANSQSRTQVVHHRCFRAHSRFQLLILKGIRA